MSPSFQKIISLFEDCPTPESKYERIIQLGKELPPLSNDEQIPENLVKGCQSRTYLITSIQNNHLYFKTQSDALISAGLAALMVLAYSAQTPETILTTPPTFIDALGLSSNLTPSRINGLHSLHLRMKQEALKALCA